MMRAVLLSVLLLGLAGCETIATQPDPDSAVPLPADYRVAAPALPVATAGAARDDWWQQYGSAELDALVARALEYNPELRTAALQVVQAKVRLDQAQAGGLPSLAAPLRLVNQGSSTTDTQQSSQVSVQGSYRMDIWGEQRASVESAEQQFWRAVWERANVQRTVIANVVLAYIAYLVAGDSLLLAQENVKLAQSMLELLVQRADAGDATAIELQQQRAALYAQQALIPGLENQRDDARTSLARLLGTVAGDVPVSDLGIDALALPTLDVALPSQLLLRRPDIRMAEARLQAANANIDVARARLLPPLDLTAQAGYSSFAITQMLQPQSLFWSTVASLGVTIFDGGRRQGEVTVAQAVREEMVVSYAQTVYQAVREVESALVSLKASNTRLEAQQRALRTALNLYQLNHEAYAAGAVDLTAVLDARRNHQRNYDDVLRTKSELLRAYASLAQALGSGAQER